MTKEELAAELNGVEYGDGNTIPQGGVKIAKESGLVIVYGASDDLAELCGAIDSEIGCYNGGEIPLTEKHVLYPPEECGCRDLEQCPFLKAEYDKCKKIKVVWCGDSGFAWAYETDIPHATFEIYEDGEKYCRGIVFDINSLKN